MSTSIFPGILLYWNNASPVLLTKTETSEPNEPDEPDTEPIAEEETPDKLIRSGLDFFSGLARTLSSPDATEKSVSSLIEEDKTTGETHLKILVKDKESVMQIFNLFGKLMSGNK